MTALKVKSLVDWFDSTDQQITSVGEIFTTYVRDDKTFVTFPNGEEVVIGINGEVWDEWKIVE